MITSIVRWDGCVRALAWVWLGLAWEGKRSPLFLSFPALPPPFLSFSLFFFTIPPLLVRVVDDDKTF